MILLLEIECCGVRMQARRKKLVVEQQAARTAAESRVETDSLLEVLVRQSAEEQKLGQRLWQLRQEKVGTAVWHLQSSLTPTSPISCSTWLFSCHLACSGPSFGQAAAQTRWVLIVRLCTARWFAGCYGG